LIEPLKMVLTLIRVSLTQLHPIELLT